MSFTTTAPRRRRVDVLHVNGSTVVRLTSREIMSASAGFEFGEEMHGIYEREKRRRIVLDLDGVTELCNTALSRLQKLQEKMLRENARLVLCNVGRRLSAAFQARHLNYLFPILGTRPEALERLDPAWKMDHKLLTVDDSRHDRIVVRFRDRKLIDGSQIGRIAEELYAIAEFGDHRDIVLDLHNISFLSSAMLNRFIFLRRKLHARSRGLKLGNVHPDIREVFRLTRTEEDFDFIEPEPAMVMAL